MKTLTCYCHTCTMEYEITYNDKEYIKPEFCAACGVNDSTLEITEKDTPKTAQEELFAILEDKTNKVQDIQIDSVESVRELRGQ